MTADRSHAMTIPAWAAYIVAAIIWPIWCEAGVAFGATAGVVLTRLGLGGSATAGGILAAILVWTLASWGFARWLRGRVPRRLWVVTAVWLVVVSAIAVTGFLLADVRIWLGILGVVGPFLFGAIGFATGLRGSD